MLTETSPGAFRAPRGSCLLAGGPFIHTERLKQGLALALRPAPIVPVVNDRCLFALPPLPSFKKRGYACSDLDTARVVLGGEDALIRRAFTRQALRDNLRSSCHDATTSRTIWAVDNRWAGFRDPKCRGTRFPFPTLVDPTLSLHRKIGRIPQVLLRVITKLKSGSWYLADRGELFGFEQVRRSLRALAPHRLLERSEVRRFEHLAAEARAATNSYLLEALAAAETEEAGRLYGRRKARQRREEEEQR